MFENTIAEINKQGAAYSKHSNEWNVMQQLIDILHVQPDCAEIVFQDLSIKEMTITALVKKITSKRLTNPVEVMKEICKFYSIPCPDELPPETWRSDVPVKSKKLPAAKASESLSLLDLM